jgi:hypothetical protein
VTLTTEEVEVTARDYRAGARTCCGDGWESLPVSGVWVEPESGVRGLIAGIQPTYNVEPAWEVLLEGKPCVVTKRSA